MISRFNTHIKYRKCLFSPFIILQTGCYRLKTRTYDYLKKHGANWVSELPSVIWGTGQHQAEPPGRPRSSWSTGPKPVFPRKSSWAPLRSRLSRSLCRDSCGVKTWTSSTSIDGKRPSEMHSTTKRSGATTNGSCIVGSSGSGT
jgi:hypothetical protein